MAWGDIGGAIFKGTGNTLLIFGWTVLIGGIAITLLLVAVSWWYFKKRWNLNVEIKLVRSDGRITIGEWGKGLYNAKRGVVFIKREGVWFGSTPMPIFDIKKYLQGEKLLTVVQVGPDDYRPVLNDSWTKHSVEYENDETGEIVEVKESILNIKIDTAMNKAWKSAWENAAKKAYSLTSFFTQFQTPIAIGIVIIACFVGFAIIWTRLGSIC